MIKKVLAITITLVIAGCSIFLDYIIHKPYKLIQIDINKIESISVYNSVKRIRVKKVITKQDDIEEIVSFFNTLDVRREATDNDFPEGSHGQPFLFNLKDGNYFIIDFWLTDHINGGGTVTNDKDCRRYVVASSDFIDIWPSIKYNEVHITINDYNREVNLMRKHDLMGINNPELIRIMRENMLDD